MYLFQKRKYRIKNLLLRSTYHYICTEFRYKDKVEPPSPILNNFSSLADQQSDDPLSGCIFMVVNTPSEDDGYSVCAYSVRTGLSYIGNAGGIES